MQPPAHRCAALLLLLLTLGCDKKPEPKSQPVETQHELEAPEVAQLATPASKPNSQAAPTVEIVWNVPDGWKTMPARMMRKATYEAPGDAGPAEIGVFYFGPGQGGGVEANIQRWLGQFSNIADGAMKRSEEELNGMKRFNIDIERGTFQSGMPGGPSSPQKDWALAASIVETPVGHYYFKMTGPAQTVAAQKQALSQMLATVATGN